MNKKLFLLNIFFVSTYGSSYNLKTIVAAANSYAVGSICLSGWFSSASYNKENYSKNKFKRLGAGLEALFRGAKSLPQYKYIARPTYKVCGGSEYPLFSVPMSFATTDLVMHRVVPEVTFLLISSENRTLLKQNWSIYMKNRFFHTGHRIGFAFWMLLSIPVALHKYSNS